MTEILHLKYRPLSLDEVVGQGPVVKSVKRQIKDATAHTYLFCGPSGCGKTTLARIVAREVGCEATDILEIDAATHTGVDAMRQVKDSLQYKSLNSGKRAVIIDECHALSKQAWQSLLKLLEEPPEHAYLFLCTTEASKVPLTIKTRCASYVLKSVSAPVLTELLEDIIEQEGMDVDDGVLELVVSESNGSPRQALTNLAVCAEAKDKKEAAQLLQSAADSDPVITLARFLIGKRGSFKSAVSLVMKISEAGVQPESARIVLTRYFLGALKKVTNDKEAMRLLFILECFSQPFTQTDDAAPLLLAVGSVMYGGD